MRKDIEGTFKVVNDANNILQKLLDDNKMAELNGEIDGLKARMEVLNRMDEKLKFLSEFNSTIKVFDGTLTELENWLIEGKRRKDELLNPTETIEPQERVMATMELQSDVDTQIEKTKAAAEEWDKLKPTEAGEDTPEAKSFASRQDAMSSTLSTMNDEVRAEGAKFGEDRRKKAMGMPRPNNLVEAKDFFNQTKIWLADAESLDNILEQSNESAKKMTLHEDSDVKYKALKERLAAVLVIAKEWIEKYDGMIKVWDKQAETAAKVSAAISSKPGDGSGSEMKLEDLEKTFGFLETNVYRKKQKMMEGLSQEAANAAILESKEEAVPPAA
ncbi:unnamed protein product [Lepeophtheirus salmonis]|uniref:(salmon louse) hypothetical protein n=1 Tax=Lepeophtheirus salmonis TaxID=72036 RepID=A0A7R8CXH4_LEPSM|nr:unnamed protein product [Lepeophtheirus salmonis]CAF2960151.1 unnamed protein product [Lepeophtheirus salmonis]